MCIHGNIHINGAFVASQVCRPGRKTVLKGFKFDQPSTHYRVNVNLARYYSTDTRPTIER